MLTKAWCWTQFWFWWVQSTLSYPVSLRFIIILVSHLCLVLPSINYLLFGSWGKLYMHFSSQPSGYPIPSLITQNSAINVELIIPCNFYFFSPPTKSKTILFSKTARLKYIPPIKQFKHACLLVFTIGYSHYKGYSRDEENIGQLDAGCSHISPVLAKNTDYGIHISFPHFRK
jgi:hypothetical protein